MKEPIRFAGLDLHTDEQSAPNSALALCAGVECEGGTLKPSFLSYTDMNFSKVKSGAELIYLHESSSYKNYVCKLNDVYGFFYYDSTGQLKWKDIPTITASDNTKIQHVGNTLIFNIDGEIYYVLFKDGSYKYLGQKPPFVELQFGTTDYVLHDDIPADLRPKSLLTGSGAEVPKRVFFRHDKASIDKASNLLETKTENTYATDIKTDKQSDFTEAVKAFVNKANSFLAENDCFYAPFLVRYAYRLYDGESLIMHSSPVFIPVSMPNTYGIPLEDSFGRTIKAQPFNVAVLNFADNGRIYAYDNAKAGEDSYNGGVCFLYSPGNVQLQYKCLDTNSFASLKNDWADIVKSIDVFITAPIVNWDQSKLISNLYSCVNANNHYMSATLVNGSYFKMALAQTEQPKLVSGEVNLIAEMFVDFPGYNDKDTEDMVTAASEFFLLHSFELTDNMPTKLTKVPIKKGRLSAITAQRQMVDDYKSHNIISGKNTFVYNHRLHVGDVTEKLFCGFSASIMTPYWDKLNGANTSDYVNVSEIYVRLSTQDGKKTVKVTDVDAKWLNLCTKMPIYLFYPDSRAVGMTLSIDTGENVIFYNIPLKESMALNGAVWFGYLADLSDSTQSDNADSSGDDIVVYSNKLYVAPVDNPFVFEPSGIMTVGVGSILGIAVATRAISPGQYGTFPLIVFCSDGIWMFSVDKEGRYADPSYLSSEVVSKPDSITQLDQSVVFATSRAMNKLAADQVQDFTLPLDGSPFSADDLPRLNDWLKDNTNWKSLIDSNSGNPIDAIINSKVLYDVVNYRLLFVPDTASTDNQMVYVYNIATGLWSTMLVPAIKSIINGFPHPHVVLKNGTTVRLDKKQDISDTQTSHYGLIVTRALKFEGVHKCIQAFDHSHSMGTPPMMFLYGSNNLQKWYYIGRSNQQRSAYMPGATWRYFRMCLLLDMTAAERFYVTHFDIVEKYRKL